MPITKKQLAARMNGIGGSDAPILLNLLTKYNKTPDWLFELKTGQRQPDPPNQAMYWGDTLEPIIRKEFSKQFRLNVETPKQTFVHPDYPFMLCHPDGLTEDQGILEIKNTRYLKDAPPDYHLCQVQHNLAVMNRSHGYLVYLVGGCELTICPISRDREFLAMLIDIEREFWNRVMAYRAKQEESLCQPT
jgi:putative phage-type endonuclease